MPGRVARMRSATSLPSICGMITSVMSRWMRRSKAAATVSASAPLAAVTTNASAARHWLAVQPPNLEEAREAVSGAIQGANRASGVIKRIRALLQHQGLHVDTTTVQISHAKPLGPLHRLESESPIFILRARKV